MSQPRFERCPGDRLLVESQILASLLSKPSRVELPPREDVRTWEHILTGAREQGLCGLLLEALADRESDVPPSVIDGLTGERTRIASVNSHFLSGLERIAEAFEREGIDVMVLKGAALLLCLYEHPGLRPMCDIDLLIRPADAGRAERLLAELGYGRGNSLLRDDFYPRYHYEAEYLGAGPHAIRLDLHVRPWRPLRYRQTVPEDAMWERRRFVPIGGARVSIPGRSDLLVHLMCHAAFHGGTRLLWLLDIHRFAARCVDEADWDHAVGRLGEWKLGHAARFVLDRVEAVVGPCVPEPARRMLWSQGSCWRDRLVLRQSPRDRASPWRATAVAVLCTPGWRFGLGYLRAVLLPDQAHLGECYSGRHPGWRWCARGTRAVSAVARGVGSLVRPANFSHRTVGERELAR